MSIHKIKITETDAVTGVTIERDATQDELSQYETDQAAYVARIANEEAKATQRQAVLDRLGLTSEEAQLILGGSN
jgi:hypothetical protein